MADATYSEEQKARLWEPHIAPITEFVDTLSGGERGWVPYVAPSHGGVNARVLSLLRDPGPKTQAGIGSGMLSAENDDPTAERMSVLYARAGIDQADVLPWNAYPWYVNRALTAAERQAGIAPLVELLGLAPNLSVVLLQGNDAQDSWRRLVKAHPTIETDRKLRVIPVIHPGRQALFHSDPVVRAGRIALQEAGFAEVARILG